MGSVLSVDDIEIGQTVAVHSFRPTPGAVIDRGVAIPDTIGHIPCGVPILVKALSLPFVACEVISSEGEEVGPAIIDIRKVRLCKLKNEYVQAIIANPNRQTSLEEQNEVPF